MLASKQLMTFLPIGRERRCVSRAALRLRAAPATALTVVNYFDAF
jgi:hypothetical protein